MPIALLLIGAILLITAFQNTTGQLATELENDLPGYFKWMVAIAAVLGLGYIPAFRTPSRWLLALIVVVIVLVNYKQALAGFTNFAGSSGQAAGTTAADPAQQFAATGTPPTTAQVSGDPGGAVSSAATTTTGQATGGAASGGVAAIVASNATQASAVTQATSAVASAPNLLDPSTWLGMASGFGGSFL